MYTRRQNWEHIININTIKQEIIEHKELNRLDDTSRRYESL